MVQFRALIRLYSLAWVRSRGPWIWLALAAIIIWYDLEIGVDSANWWSTWISIAVLAGFLSSYDTYTRFREDGSLRLLLLQPVRRSVVAVAFLLAAGILVAAMVVLFLIYLVIVGRAPLSPVLAGDVLFVWLGALGFVGYAQLASLLLPRDTSAVAGLLIVVAGSGSLDRWLPESTPEWVLSIMSGIEFLIPMGARMNELFTSDAFPGALVVIVVQLIVVVFFLRLTLERPRFVARKIEA